MAQEVVWIYQRDNQNP